MRSPEPGRTEEGAAVVALAAPTLGADLVELTKPGIAVMVTLTAFVGFVMAAPESWSVLPVVLGGTALVASGAGTLNMLIERHLDARMRRTAARPLPAGRLRPRDALAWGLLLTASGTALLAAGCGPAPALVALTTWATYLFLYTPLKPVTSLATVVGALPGALPPLIGWTAARADLGAGAFLLFAVMFLWQLPHFLAIAWLYREDYGRAGLPMLPCLDSDGALTGRQAVANTVACVLVSLLAVPAGIATPGFLVGAGVLGVLFLAAALRFAFERSLARARRLFLASIAYLPALLTLLVAFRR